MCSGSNCSGCTDCSDKIYTGDVEFNGEFNNIVVQEGSDLNDVLLLMEGYVDEKFIALNELTYTVTTPNNFGLAAGIYSYAQMFSAINAVLGTSEITSSFYKARLIQEVTDPPSELETFGTDDIEGVWSRSAAGSYYYTKTGAFPANKTIITLTNNVRVDVIIQAERVSVNQIQLSSVDFSGAAADELIDNLYLTIEVLP